MKNIIEKISIIIVLALPVYSFGFELYSTGVGYNSVDNSPPIMLMA